MTGRFSPVFDPNDLIYTQYQVSDNAGGQADPD